MPDVPPPQNKPSRIPVLPLTLLVGAGAGFAYGAFVAHIPAGPPLALVGLGGAVLAFCGRAFFRMMDPLARSEEELAARQGRELPARRRDLERDKQLALKAIREVELDFQMRKVSREDYEEMTQRYRARAMRIIRELDAGDDYRLLIEQELKARLRVAEPLPEDPASAAKQEAGS